MNINIKNGNGIGPNSFCPKTGLLWRLIQSFFFFFVTFFGNWITTKIENNYKNCWKILICNQQRFYYISWDQIMTLSCDTNILLTIQSKIFKQNCRWIAVKCGTNINDLQWMMNTVPACGWFPDILKCLFSFFFFLNIQHFALVQKDVCENVLIFLCWVFRYL